ncbi:uncharacterized protein LOC143275684 [Babylonia areolata]|uniref:uncharacterized protein LOC143275684 n=1 Tax=Babylonia areolata TaxID=304850 RepID=UPI003FD5F897
MHHHRTMPGDFHGDRRSGIKGARKHHALKGSAGRTGVVVVCVVAVVVFLASAGLGVACFYRRSRSRSFRVPHARLQEAAAQAQGTATTPTQQNRPPDRSEGPTPAGPATVRQTPTAPIPTPTNTPTHTHTHTAGRAPPPLSHLKVFYSRRPSAEQVRIEEGLDNPSYDEAAVSMMPGGRPVMRQSGSEDNQPTL